MSIYGEAARRSHAQQWLERSLIAFGVVCLLLYAFFTVQRSLYQRQAKAELGRMMEAKTRESAPPTTESPTMTRTAPSVPNLAPLAAGTVLGRVDVPRLKLSAAIAEGDDDSTLGNAVGHLPDTPMPWQPTGNSAFAAHRDGLFRPLRDIRVNDEVNVVTLKGQFLYRVTKTQVVNPEDVWVLAPTATPSLTLITCYPFSFVGHAPQRFIVQAERVEPDPPGVAFKGTVVK